LTGIDVARLIRRVAAPYPFILAEFELLAPSYGKYLLARIRTTDNGQYVLKERPGHISLDDWCFHHCIPIDDTAPAVLPRLLLTRDGKPCTQVDEREFELTEWLPGNAKCLQSEEHLLTAAKVLADVHNWLFAVRCENLPRRLQATTNNISYWNERLRRSKTCTAKIEQFLCRAESLLVALPEDTVSLVHGDYHGYNLLWQGERITAVLDWEDAHMNSPLFDIAYLLAHTVFIDWPERMRGQEAWVREAVDSDLVARVLHVYRRRLRYPLSACGLARELITCWNVTLIATVFRALVGVTVDDESMDRARAILEWIATEKNLKPWHAILETP